MSLQTLAVSLILTWYLYFGHFFKKKNITLKYSKQSSAVKQPDNLTSFGLWTYSHFSPKLSFSNFSKRRLSLCGGCKFHCGLMAYIQVQKGLLTLNSSCFLLKRMDSSRTRLTVQWIHHWTMTALALIYSSWQWTPTHSQWWGWRITKEQLSSSSYSAVKERLSLAWTSSRWPPWASLLMLSLLLLLPL